MKPVEIVRNKEETRAEYDHENNEKYLYFIKLSDTE